MNKNLLNYLEEGQVAFLKTPKFLRKLVTPSGAELYALLKEKRNYLIRQKKIKNGDSYFFYNLNEMKDDLLKPNSTNTIKELLQRLFELGLVDTKISKTPFNIKYYRLNDDAYLKLATEEADNWKKRVDDEYEKAKEGPDNDDQEFEPVTPLDFNED